MSDADREKWDNRYREGAYAERGHASAYLVECLPLMQPPRARALDLACGAGRNALYLASQGFTVDAVDIATEALLRGSQAAEAASLQGINWVQQDLDAGLPGGLDDYGLIIMMRYLDITLLRAAAQQLLPGGYLLAEVHLQTDQKVAGPSGSAFRAVAGDLKTAATDLDIIDYSEGLELDPDGRQVALARLLARAVTG
ncbi:MAG: methyltransferase domain-containing protein [Pseudohongiella sp.]